VSDPADVDRVVAARQFRGHVADKVDHRAVQEGQALRFGPGNHEAFLRPAGEMH